MVGGYGLLKTSWLLYYDVYPWVLNVASNFVHTFFLVHSRSTRPVLIGNKKSRRFYVSQIKFTLILPMCISEHFHTSTLETEST